MERISYVIHSCSGYAGEYSPQGIVEDKPSDTKSRWLSDTSNPPQYVMLKLLRPAIVKEIQFGKFETSHACNIKHLEVHGGMEVDNLAKLTEGTLSNNSQPESFPLRHKVTNQPFPVLYIKIVPLQSWGQGFNYSIWYVELRGVVEQSCVDQALKSFKKHREREAIRLCLKHLREHDYTDVFEALRKKACVELEHPLLSQLHTTLVEKGDFADVEKLMLKVADEGFLDGYIASQPIVVKWSTVESEGVIMDLDHATHPGMRGGHQMCADPLKGVLYLHGGWDGSKDLGDFWRYDAHLNTWTCLCQDTSLVGGPSPRSCHKMCLDSENQVIYMLGRYLDTGTRGALFTLNIPSDFYSYHIATNTWTLLSEDTYQDSGPRLIYDHQMCFDANTKSIYVSGGRVLTSNFIGVENYSTYSGLYVYQCPDSKWVCLRSDHTGAHRPADLIPRMAHCAVFHPELRQLFVMGGQREKQPLSDMLVYDVTSDEVRVLADGKRQSIPASGFTLRTTLDPKRKEIHLFVGLNKLSNEDGAQTVNSYWIYTIRQDEWICISQCDKKACHAGPFPSPRYAHQFVYDGSSDVHYMFGGNPGTEDQKIRLDDFWRLKLIRTNKDQLMRRCQFMIRRNRFEELTGEDSIQALSYLQNEVAAVVNLDDPDERKEFHGLTSQLFSVDNCDSERSKNAARKELYGYLVELFPEHMAQPRSSLVNMIRI